MLSTRSRRLNKEKILSQTISLEQLEAQNGEQAGLSDWILIDQNMINQFAAVTLDNQYIHTDPERAAKTPFGGTIAHGFLTLSLTSQMATQCLPQVDGAVMSINYGCDKLRFISPVPSGSRIRGRYIQTKIEKKPHNRIIIHHNLTVEIEGADKPALIADWLTMCAFA